MDVWHDAAAQKRWLRRFALLTGVLLLPVRTGTGAFYRKRIGRVLLALVFWSLTLPVLYYLYMRYVGTSSPSIDPALFTGEATLHLSLIHI